MSSFLLQDPDCVLIHIPKNGGSSIRKGIWEQRYEGPHFGPLPESWKAYFCFAFVRHPLDRVVSAYCDFTQLRAYKKGFDDFLRVVVDDSVPYNDGGKTANSRIRHHTLPQTHPFNALADADHVGRFESYAEDLRAILDRVGMKAGSLPAERKTSHGDWREYYSPDALEMAVEFFREDFAQLDYPLP